MIGAVEKQEKLVRQVVAALSGGLEKNQVMMAEERQGWAVKRCDISVFFFFYFVLDLNFFPKALSSSGTDRVRVKEPSDSDLTTRAWRRWEENVITRLWHIDLVDGLWHSIRKLIRHKVSWNISKYSHNSNLNTVLTFGGGEDSQGGNDSHFPSPSKPKTASQIMFKNKHPHTQTEQELILWSF